MTNHDPVNNPAHYTSGGIETIDYIRAKLNPIEFAGYLRGNVIKYASRIGHKGDAEIDAGKLAWYSAALRDAIGDAWVTEVSLVLPARHAFDTLRLAEQRYSLAEQGAKLAEECREFLAESDRLDGGRPDDAWREELADVFIVALQLVTRDAANRDALARKLERFHDRLTRGV